MKTFGETDLDLFTSILEETGEDWWVNGTSASKLADDYIKAWRRHEIKIGVSGLKNALLLCTENGLLLDGIQETFGK